jgi:hypothetical protein
MQNLVQIGELHLGMGWALAGKLIKNQGINNQTESTQKICIRVFLVIGPKFKKSCKCLVKKIKICNNVTEEKHVISPSMTPIVSKWLDFFSG